MAFRFVVGFLICVNALAQAASSENPTIWQDLAENDSPEVVARKLSARPEIKQARAKPGNVSVSYRGPGLLVLGDAYQLRFQFDDGRLRRVGLVTEPGCANKATQAYSAMVAALSGKYPTHVDDGTGQKASDVEAAIRRATDENPTVVTATFTDGKVVVMYVQTFTADRRPPLVATQRGALAGALADYLWSEYQQRRDECDGTGNTRLTNQLFFMSSAEYQASVDRLVKEQADKLKAARSNL